MIEICGTKFKEFSAKVGNDELVFNPPKIKPLRQMTEAAKKQDLDAVIEVTRLILNTNKQGKKYTTEFIENNFDIEDLSNLNGAYFEWVKSIKENPNS